MNLIHLLSLISITSAIHFPASTGGSRDTRDQLQVNQIPGLPGVPPSWAGRISAPTGAKLFFWLFQAEDQTGDDSLIIWLNGGPGCSSLISLATGNGPFVLRDHDLNPRINPFSWTKLANVLYVDQPVGTGFSLGNNRATNNAEVTASFISWLGAFYDHFPHLRSKRTHMMGESYAGVYIPYFAQAILIDAKSLDINLKSISLGDGTFGNNDAMSDVSIFAYLQEQQPALRIPDQILDAFDSAAESCGFNNRLNQAEYPPHGKIFLPGNPHGDTPLLSSGQRSLSGYADCNIEPTAPGRITESIFHSPCYPQCAIFQTAVDYLTAVIPCFSIYNILESCQVTDPLHAVEVFFNRLDVRHALHIGDSDPPYQACNRGVLNNLTAEVSLIPPAYTILPSILAGGVQVHIYAGTYDMLVNHKGIELVVQNMTWDGAQGLQERPSRRFAGGRWTHGRGLTYHLFEKAGHTVPKDRPEEAFGFVRDFIVSSRGYDWEDEERNDVYIPTFPKDSSVI